MKYEWYSQKKNKYKHQIRILSSVFFADRKKNTIPLNNRVILAIQNQLSILNNGIFTPHAREATLFHLEYHCCENTTNAFEYCKLKFIRMVHKIAVVLFLGVFCFKNPSCEFLFVVNSRKTTFKILLAMVFMLKLFPNFPMLWIRIMRGILKMMFFLLILTILNVFLR